MNTFTHIPWLVDEVDRMVQRAKTVMDKIICNSDGTPLTDEQRRAIVEMFESAEPADDTD